MRKLFSKPAIFVFLVVLLLVFGGVFIKKRLTTLSPGGSCGGLVMPKYEWMRTLKFWPPKCGRGYMCDYSDNPPDLIDAPGACTKLVLGKTYTIPGSHILSNYPTSLYYSEENLEVIIIGFDDECEKYNSQQGSTGCVNAGKITWYITARKDDKKIEFPVTSERHGSVLKKEMSYVFDFTEINRYSLKFKITKSPS